MAEEEAVEADPAAMVNAAGKGDMAVVRKQLKAGVAVDATNKYEQTALIKAAEGNQTKMSKFLVTRGADANAKDKGGWTAMMKAAANGNGARRILARERRRGQRAERQRDDCPDVCG